jgi:DNA replication protein DnaC
VHALLPGQIRHLRLDQVDLPGRRLDPGGLDHPLDEFTVTAICGYLDFRNHRWPANPDVPAALIHTLARSAWVAAGQPCCLIGDSGTGKSHLLIGLGTAAAENGYRVKYTTAAALVNELVEAADDKTLSRTIARYGRVDLLCLDELGYLELDRRGAELLFQVFTEREERSSIATSR